MKRLLHAFVCSVMNNTIPLLSLSIGDPGNPTAVFIIFRLSDANSILMELKKQLVPEDWAKLEDLVGVFKECPVEYRDLPMRRYVGDDALPQYLLGSMASVAVAQDQDDGEEKQGPERYLQ